MSEIIEHRGPQAGVAVHLLPGLDALTHYDGRMFAVFLDGEADLSNGAELQLVLDAAPIGCERVQVDIADLTFVGSSLLRALLLSHARLASRGAVLEVRRPTPYARRVFEITNLTWLLAD